MDWNKDHMSQNLERFGTHCAKNDGTQDSAIARYAFLLSLENDVQFPLLRNSTKSALWEERDPPPVR